MIFKPVLDVCVLLNKFKTCPFLCFLIKLEIVLISFSDIKQVSNACKDFQKWKWLTNVIQTWSRHLSIRINKNPLLLLQNDDEI